ncbi:MAG: hypothetical protein IT198_02755 [Acidimicrobiia bacterium]|nr:hypothetical protein [Acidimicrobiia bacterium]
MDFALRMLAAEPLDLDGARGPRGSGWEGDPDLGVDRVPPGHRQCNLRAPPTEPISTA